MSSIVCKPSLTRPACTTRERPPLSVIPARPLGYLRQQRVHSEACHLRTVKSVLSRAASVLQESREVVVLPPHEQQEQHEQFGETFVAGRVQLIHSPEELEYYLTAYQHRLVVLKCKAKGCRPCIAFIKKYQRAAATFKDCVFLEIYGDESSATRALMLSMEVKSTPTFRLYRSGTTVASVSGIVEGKLVAAIQKHLQPGEVGYGADNCLETTAVP